MIAMLSGPAMAQECPDVPDHTEALSALFQQAQAADSHMAARAISDEMWLLWADAPDDHAQDLLNEAMDRRRVADYDGAALAATALIDYCPDYAEGYNQRAFVNFLRQDYDAALPDLDDTLKLSPRHIGALTGRALTLVALDRKAEAALDLRAALALNPWLSERQLLAIIEAEEDSL